MFDRKYLAVTLLLVLFSYTRIVGIDWGLPFPMHPDERNIATAVQDLSCPSESTLQDCFNPHFFAYGQFPIYSSFVMVKAWHVFKGIPEQSISFVEATLALRYLSVFASFLNLFFILKIVALFQKNNKVSLQTITLSILLFTFTPYAIQFAHFGTTESLLMAVYTGIVYYSLRLLSGTSQNYPMYLAALLVGLGLATKISSIFFMGIPIIAILRSNEGSLPKKILSIGTLVFFAICAAVFFSPHNVISYEDFRSAMNFEIGIGQGTVIAFYNRQFDNTVPFLFQFTRIFPYTLGMVQFLMALLAVMLLPYSKKYNLLRIAFFLFFIPSAVFYAKWTRFIAPILPIVTIFIILAVDNILRKYKNPFFLLITLLLLLPGIAYLAVYRNTDVRFTATEWVKTNIPTSANVLSETANVVDIPIHAGYNVASFDLYHVDADESLKEKLAFFTQDADYIFIPSRRIFANNTCYRFIDGEPTLKTDGLAIHIEGYRMDTCTDLEQKYPRINEYYEGLFSGALPYVKIAEFTSYPRITVFGKTIYEIRDENAEETWTVFDHPVIRIYKRI